MYFYPPNGLVRVCTSTLRIPFCNLAVIFEDKISWFRLNRNIVVLFYGLASATLSINMALTLAFVYGPFLNFPREIGPNLQVAFYTFGADYFNSASIISSIISFIFTWVATALLLTPYSRKSGRIKYWFTVSLPLVYFLSQFPSFYLNIFASLLNADPVFYGILLSVLFIISKAAGGIFFGVAFWLTSRTLKRNNVVRQYLIVAAVGFALLFVSNQATLLVNAPYPPLGLASVSLMGLASYLILIGIYSSAISVSEDSKLRQKIRCLTAQEPNLLDIIGTAEMQREIEKRVISLTKQNQNKLAEDRVLVG